MRLALNPSQLRNLRNWAEADLPGHTLTLLHPIDPPMSAGRVLGAVADLARAHEGLRSRLVTDDTGEQAQEVLSAEAWTALLPGPIEVVSGTEVTRTPIPVDPAEGSLRGVVYLREGLATAVKLSISHVFVDGLGRQAATRHLVALLDGDRAGLAEFRQSSHYAKGPRDPGVARSTGYWKQVHAEAPRACVFAAVRREPAETADGAQVSLTPGEAEAFARACRDLGVGAHAAWIGVMSAVVRRLSGNTRQVFKTTMANRLRRADLSAVAQLAQPVFPVFDGGPQDTLAAWLATAERSLAPATRHGMYDANELLDWLNHGDGFTGAVFQPAFELNFLPPTPRAQAETLYGRPVEETFTEPAHIDPHAAKPDLVLTIRHFPEPSLRVVARRPLRTQTTAAAIAGHMRTVVTAISRAPGILVSALPIPRLPGVDGLLAGHRSGAPVDLAMTRALVQAATGATGDCEVRAIATESGGMRVRASLPAGTDSHALRTRMRELLPWHGGAVIPDELHIGER